VSGLNIQSGPSRQKSAGACLPENNVHTNFGSLIEAEAANLPKADFGGRLSGLGYWQIVEFFRPKTCKKVHTEC
jgi:hypothetical protein